MENQSEKEINHGKKPDIAEIPDLALTMQAMSLAEPGLCRIRGNEVMKQEVWDFSCSLIMKVANTGGSPRFISQKALEEAMSRAWKEKIYGISQVSNSVFMAHFRTQEDMISVYIKQPLVANSENLLLDWFDPNLIATSSADYKFDSILVTVRAYGIPRNKRSISLLKDILNKVGEVSDFHILQENNLFAKQDYIWETAKLMVNNPLKDKAVVTFDDNSSTIVYLHYERIKRACLFCGIMFHNAQDCTIRNSLISRRQRNRQSSADIPSQRFGQWIVNEKLIPTELIHNARMGDQASSQNGSEILQRLRQMFAEKPKEKGKIIESPSSSQAILETQNTSIPPLWRQIGAADLASPTENQKEEERPLVPTPAGQHEHNHQNSQHNENLNKGGNVTTRVLEIANQQKPTEVMSSPGVHSRTMNSKRSAPSVEEASQPEAKKQMAIQYNQSNLQGTQMQMGVAGNQIRPSIMQCAIRATPPYNPSLTLAQNAEMMNSILGCQNFPTGTGILGEALTHNQLFAPGNATTSNKRVKRRPTGWDVQAQGTTSYTQGAAIWRRNAQVPQVQDSPSTRKTGAIPASPCRSDATSAAAGYFVHEPWPLHTPANSFSQGTQVSRQGVFSPPHMARELNEASNYHAGPSKEVGQGNATVRMAEGQTDGTQNALDKTHGSENIETKTQEAGAPAFKAPHAP